MEAKTKGTSPQGGMGARVGRWFMQYAGQFAFQIILFVVLAIASPTFRTPANLINVARQVSVNMIIACAMTMVLIGMMFSGMSLRSMLDRNTLFISALRLVILPALLLAGCRLAGIDPFLTGVCLLITGMPAGSTSAILAAKYGCDYTFATKCIVISTLLSLISIPVWAMILG